MGPTGDLLEPMGNMSYADCQAAFAEQARGLVEGGVDVLWIETMSDLNEVKAAIEGARSVSADIPICATMSFDTRGRTMMGVTGAQLVAELGGMGLTALGANCGNNLPDTEATLAQMHAAAPDLILIAKANAGIPRYEGDKLIYDGSPEVMGAYADRVRQNGVRMVGACCGSSPAHIHTISQVLSGAIPVPDVEAPGAASAVVAGGESSERSRTRRVRHG